MDATLSKSIAQITELITLANKKAFLLPHSNPINLEEERQKFFNSKNYNPNFIYNYNISTEFDDLISSAKLILNELRSLADLHTYFEELIENTTYKYHMKLNIGDNEKFTYYSEKVFPWEINISYEDLITTLKKSETSSKKRNASEIKSIFEVRLHESHLNNWLVEISETSTDNIYVNGFEKTVFIGKNVERSEEDTKRLIAHEIETHVFRKINALNQDLKLFQTSFLKNTTFFEEGLAVYNEHKSGNSTLYANKTYAARILTVNNYNLSFRELYNINSEFFDMNAAFNIVTRVKRGLSDTSKPGGFKKDSAYLCGYLYLKSLNLTNDDLHFLYNGKITLNEKILLKYNILKDLKNKIIPSYYE